MHAIANFKTFMKTPLCASFSQALQTAQESWSKLAITSFSSNVLASTTENLETLSSEASESVSSQPGRFLEAATEGTNQAKIAVAEASEQAISNVTNAVGNASEPVQSAVFDLETLNSASEKAKSALEQALASLQATRDRSREALSSASRNAQSVYVENGTLPGWRNRFQALFVGGRDRAFEAGQELKISRLRAIFVLDYISSIDLGPGSLQIGIQNLLDNEYFPVDAQTRASRGRTERKKIPSFSVSPLKLDL